jgi:hypothetical protein
VSWLRFSSAVIITCPVARSGEPGNGQARGTAFGRFNRISGVCTLIASLLAGWLWQTTGSNSTFLMDAWLAEAALLLMLFKKNNT